MLQTENTTSKTVSITYCKLVRESVVKRTWIPSEYAFEGNIVQLQDGSSWKTYLVDEIYKSVNCTETTDSKDELEFV